MKTRLPRTRGTRISNRSFMSLFPAELKSFASDLPTPLYAVGGFVRDSLLGKNPHDIDLCSALSPEQICAAAQAAGISCPIVNKRLGTVQLRMTTGDYEHTTFRTESYPAGGAHEPAAVSFTDSLERDALRRDFSVNALYQNILTEQILDPTGGLKDLGRRIIRTTTADPLQILRDDGLRILRLIRFATETGFDIDPETWACAKKHVSLLEDIAWERKRGELDRILTGSDPLRSLFLMKELGSLFLLIPELKDADGMPQRQEYHRYDVLEHSFRTCAAMPSSVPFRLMGLLHDVGKPLCLKETGNFHRHAAYSAALAEEALRRLRYPSADISRIYAAVRNHMFDLDGHAKIRTLRRRFVEFGRQGTEDLIALREADIRGSGYALEYRAERWRSVYDAMLQDGCPWSISDLRIDGETLMRLLQIPPSKELSELKKRLLLHCIDRPGDNTPERLASTARSLATNIRKNC